MQRMNFRRFLVCGATIAIALSGAKSVNAQAMDVLFGQAYNVWQSWRGIGGCSRLLKVKNLASFVVRSSQEMG
jgi:hypothetical protein